MRKLIMVCTLLSFLFGPRIVEATVREGVYAGAGYGGTYDFLEYKATNLLNCNVVKKSKNRFHSLGTVFIGYGHTFNSCNGNVYLGAELGTSFPKRRVTVRRPGATFTGQTFTDHMSVQEYVNLDLLPGFRFFCDDLLFYARVGASYAHLQFSQDANAAANLTALHKKSDEWGLRVGTGINYAFCDWLGVALDYIYTGYPDISKIRRSTSTKHAQKTHTQYIGVSLIFNFPKR